MEERFVTDSSALPFQHTTYPSEHTFSEQTENYSLGISLRTVLTSKINFWLEKKKKNKVT